MANTRWQTGGSSVCESVWAAAKKSARKNAPLILQSNSVEWLAALLSPIIALGPTSAGHREHRATIERQTPRGACLPNAAGASRPCTPQKILMAHPTAKKPLPHVWQPCSAHICARAPQCRLVSSAPSERPGVAPCNCGLRIPKCGYTADARARRHALGSRSVRRVS